MEVGIIPNHLHHQGDTRWSAFHITTCHGLRLECSSLIKLQVCVMRITSAQQFPATLYVTFHLLKMPNEFSKAWTFLLKSLDFVKKSNH